MQPGIYDANPQLDDYLHRIELRRDGTFEMIDGAGQAINEIAQGSYQARKTGEGEWEISFSSIALVDSDRRSYARLADFAVGVKREVGVFNLEMHASHLPVDNAGDWPWLSSAERWVFQTDPLDFARPTQERNLFYRIASPGAIASLRAEARTYYRREACRLVRRREVSKAG